MISESGRVIYAKVARLHAAARKMLLAWPDPESPGGNVPSYVIEELQAATTDLNPEAFLPLTDTQT